MTQPTTRVLSDAPATLPLMLKAALPVIPGVGLLPGVRRSGDTLPELTLTRNDVPVDPGHVAEYSEVCGFGVRDTVPITYPHMLAFPLHMAIMTDGAFPFPAIGTVHLENAITQHRPISADETLTVTAWPQGLRPHRKGQVFDMVTEVSSGGDLVWQERCTYLRRGRGNSDAPGSDGTFEDVAPSGTEWDLPGDLGRRYAAVSGDRNPIHLYGVTAKAFGFPRQIAHGMWSKARCLAALEGRLPDAVTVEVAFRKPILLPGTVAFGSRGNGEGWAFSLSSAKSGATHLLGTATPL